MGLLSCGGPGCPRRPKGREDHRTASCKDASRAEEEILGRRQRVTRGCCRTGKTRQHAVLLAHTHAFMHNMNTHRGGCLQALGPLWCTWLISCISWVYCSPLLLLFLAACLAACPPCPDPAHTKNTPTLAAAAAAAVGVYLWKEKPWNKKTGGAKK